MGKKQIDLFGDSVSREKLVQVEERIKRRDAESLFTESKLKPILEIIKQEHDILKWPVDKLLSKIETIKSTIKKKSKTLDSIKNLFYISRFKLKYS